MLSLWRDFLDETGFWPRELVGKAVCAGMCMLMVCLTAHLAPFTIEAFFAALIANAFLVLTMPIVMGIAGGVLGALMELADRRAAAEAAEAALLRQATAGQQGVAPAMQREAAPASESAGLAEGGDPSPKELRCHDDA